MESDCVTNSMNPSQSSRDETSEFNATDDVKNPTAFVVFDFIIQFRGPGKELSTGYVSLIFHCHPHL